MKRPKELENAHASMDSLLGIAALFCMVPGSHARAEAVYEPEAEPRHSLVGAYFSIEDGRQSTLLLLNKVRKPVRVDVDVASPSGSALALGSFTVESGQHLELPLSQLLGSTGSPTPLSGSIAVRYTGYDSLQGWVILQNHSEIVELPLYPAEDTIAQRWLSFWDSSGTGAKPFFYLANTESVVTEVLISIGEGSRLSEHSIILDARSQVVFQPFHNGELLQRGWVEVQGSSASARVVLSGLLIGPKTMTALPPGPSPRPRPARRFDATRVPQGAGNGSTHVTLYNPDTEQLSLTAYWLSNADGSASFERTVTVQPGEVKKLLLPPTGAADDGVRLHLDGTVPFLVDGFAELADRTSLGLGFFPSAAGHATGSYPVLDPERYDTFTTLVNLGNDEAKVVGQIRWEGGTYSFGPIAIPAGASHRLHFDHLARQAPPDLLGRRLDPLYPNASFRWLSLGPSRDLIARTEARPAGLSDSFGFNCIYCCYQDPFGVVVPSLVEFPLGQSASFEAAIEYSTCDGGMGPYATWPDSITAPSPFTWNGQTISASDAADDDLSFSISSVEGTTDKCETYYRLIFGFGRGKMCQKTFNPKNYDPAKTCISQTTSCTACKGCCNDIYNQKICEKKNADIATSEKNACLGHCLTDLC